MKWRVGRGGTARAGSHILQRGKIRWEVKWLKTKNQWRAHKLFETREHATADRWWVRDKAVDPVFFAKEDLELAKGFAEAQLLLGE